MCELHITKCWWHPVSITLLIIQSSLFEEIIMYFDFSPIEYMTECNMEVTFGVSADGAQLTNQPTK